MSIVATLCRFSVIQVVGMCDQCLAYTIDDWKTATLLPPDESQFKYGQEVAILPGWSRKWRAALGQAAGPQEEMGSCYWCLMTFPRSQIDDYEILRGDAICPFCNIDAVTFEQHTPASLRQKRIESWPELYNSHTGDREYAKPLSQK